MGRKKIYEDEGKITLRLPADHKARAEEAAAAETRSLNFWIAEAVRRRLVQDGQLADTEKKKGGKS